MDFTHEVSSDTVNGKLFDTHDILGVKIAVTSMANAVETVCASLQRLKGKYICFTNAHTTVTAVEDAAYMNVQNSSVATFPDGNSVASSIKKEGVSGARRVTGPDFMGKVFEISAARGITHYFYGATQETLDKLKAALEEKYPGIKILGMYSPPFSSDAGSSNDQSTIDEINALSPDILWVGLGAPKQEIWMFNHMGKVSALMAGVGAGFDYHAGSLKRAPLWMQKNSLEWLYRLLQEPRRLFGRYMKTNFKYLRLTAKQRRARKKASKK